MNYSVREAQIEDLEKLVSFIEVEAVEAEQADIPLETIRKGIKIGLEDDDIANYWVLQTSEGEVIGNTSVVKEWSDWNAGYYWWIQSMFIMQEHRGKGLMELMLDKVREAGKEEGALELRLYVHKENNRAIKAYYRDGFQDCNYKIMVQDI